jgi:hypothetical protein
LSNVEPYLNKLHRLVIWFLKTLTMEQAKVDKKGTL